MKILVTGAAGFIGSHLAEHAHDLGHEVVGLDCFTDYYSRELKALNAQRLLEHAIPVLELDLADGDLRAAVADIEIVYHLAAQPGISATTPFETYVRNNLTATHKLVEAVKDAPALQCFVNVSTSSVYGAHATDPEDAPPKPTSYYGVTKLAAEQLVLAYHRDRGLPACSLRVFSAYGERERPEKLYPLLIKSILNDEPFPLFEGSEHHSRSFTYVGDVVKGLLAVLGHLDRCTGEIFNIGSDTEITTGEGIAIVEEILGRKVRVVPRPRRPGDQLHTRANIDKARRTLGYAPSVTPREGLAAEVAWYKTHIHGRVAV